MNTTDTRRPDEPHLSADFATRVLRRADTIRARRRRVRGAMAAAAGALLLALVVGPRVAPTPRREVPPTIAADSDSASDSLADFDAAWPSSSGDWALASARDEDPDALTYLFPDAAPLARFVDEYSAATYGMGMDDEAFSSAYITRRGEQL